MWHNNDSFDTGASGNGLREQDITYSVAQKLGAKLQSVGIDVNYSRNKVTDNVGTNLNSSLNKRANMANGWQANLFISLHCNAFTYPVTNGVEVCIPCGGGKAETIANYIRVPLVQIGLQDRGNKIRPELAVLKNKKMPAILVELGFLTNTKDSLILRDKQDDLANAMFNGICNYLGIQARNGGEGMAEPIYNYIDENMPQWARPTIQKLLDKGILKGNEQGKLGLNDTMLKLLVINDRAGLY